MQKVTTEDVFSAIVQNALRFLERAHQDLERGHNNFSVIHFAAGVELMLKARLFDEHWALVLTRPHEGDWNKFIQGKSHTLAASKLIGAIESASGNTISPACSRAFDDIFTYRNQNIHLMPTTPTEKVAASQCRAWYRLHQLLLEDWNSIFGDCQNEIRAFHQTMKRQQEYLRPRYNDLSERLELYRKRRTTGHVCDL